MPPLSQAMKKPANLADMVRVDTPDAAALPPIVPSEMPGLNVGTLGPTPAAFTTDYDRVRQWIRPGTSQVRLPNLPMKVNPQLHAAAVSNAKILAGQQGFTTLDKVNDGTGRQSLHSQHSAPRGGSTGNKPSVIPGGSVAFNFRKVWLSNLTYFKGDEVIYQTSYWMAMRTSTGSAPATNNANWQVVGSYSAFRGPWSSTTPYVAGDEVTYLGNFWVANVASTNSAPSFSNSNWQNAGPNNLDAVPDGTDFGRPPVSVYGPNAPIGKLTGFYVLHNPDFEHGLTNYNVYDNNSSGSVTLSLIPISSAPAGAGPNGTNQVMKIVEARVGIGPSPGLGGFYYSTALDNGQIQADSYHVGDTYIIDLLAWIPTGYSLGWNSNSLGTGGSFQWLNTAIANTYAGSLPGASAWRHYIGRVVVGASPSSANSFPFFHIDGADGVTWYVAQLHVVDINQTHRHGGWHSLVGTHGNMWGKTSDIYGTGIGTHIHFGNHRTFVDNNPGWGFYGTLGGDAGLGSFQAGTRNMFKLSASGGGPWHHINENTAVNGKTQATYFGAVDQYYTRERGTASSLKINDLTNGRHGFQGTPLYTVHGFGPTMELDNVGSPQLIAQDNAVSGVEHRFQSGNSAAGTGNIMRAGVRTAYSISPTQWGFFGTPADNLEVFASHVRTTASGGANAYRSNDTQASGREYYYASGITAAGYANIYDNTAGVNRTYLNSTPQWGFFTSPNSGIGVDIASQYTQNFVSGQPAYRANDTQASGRVYGFFSSGSAVGSNNILDVTAGAYRTFLDSTPSYGFYGSPGGFRVEINGTNTQNCLLKTVNGAGPWADLTTDAQVGGKRIGIYASSAGVFSSADASAVTSQDMTNLRLGIQGAPGVPLDVLHGAFAIRAQGAAPVINDNDTNASGRSYSFVSGDSAGVMTFDDSTSGVSRWLLNSTPQTGFYGSPANPIDIFAGGDGSPTRMRGSKPSFRVSDSDTNGRDYEFNAGNNTAAFMEFIDRSANVMRWNMDGSGNADFAAGTPATGIGAAGVAFSDLSANLKLKNVTNAVGSTSAPTTSSTSFATIPEMTFTVTTKGNKVILLFSSSITCNNPQFAQFQFFMDGVGQGANFLETSVNTAEQIISLQLILTPSAASHTFDVRWAVGGGALLKALGTARQMQLTELG